MKRITILVVSIIIIAFTAWVSSHNKPRVPLDCESSQGDWAAWVYDRPDSLK